MPDCNLLDRPYTHSLNGRSSLGAPASLRPFDSPLIDLNGKSTLVTGGTGSFGQKFVRIVTGRSSFGAATGRGLRPAPPSMQDR